MRVTMEGQAYASESDPSLVVIPHVDDVLLGAPIFCGGGRFGRSWFATIWRDATGPGGLARRFHSRSFGPQEFYTIDTLAIGDAVEFAADLLGARRIYRRWWGVVEAKDPTTVTFRQYPTARQAIKAAVLPVLEVTGVPV